MPLFKRRSAPQSLFAFYLSGESGSLPAGYHRLLDSPEISACINRIAGVIASSTIYLMENTPKGDKRLRNSSLARFLDVDPWPGHATRYSWMCWIIAELLGRGDGNACVLPRTVGGRLSAAVPMVNAGIEPVPGDAMDYQVRYNGRLYDPEDVLHFRLFADPDAPYKGRGYRVQAEALAASLKQTEALKNALSSPEYKPPLIVSVDSEADFSDDESRERLRKKYIEDTETGKPWIIPAGLVKVEQVKPLSLTDLAVKDTVELDKKAVCSLFGMPPSLLGLGSFSQAEWNNAIRTTVIPIVTGIEQELTLKLLHSEKMYWQFNRRRLYSYDLKELVAMDLEMSDRGFMNGDEVREDAYRDPAGLTEYRVLENYIPWDKAGEQGKLSLLNNKKEDADNAD